MSEIQNAKITSTMLGLEDHGIFTSCIYLSLADGGSMGFGGYVLGGKSGVAFIKEILKVVDVDEWEQLKGKHVRVKLDGYSGPMKSIGNLMKDEWLEPKEFFKSYND